MSQLCQDSHFWVAHFFFTVSWAPFEPDFLVHCVPVEALCCVTKHCPPPVSDHQCTWTLIIQVGDKFKTLKIYWVELSVSCFTQSSATLIMFKMTNRQTMLVINFHDMTHDNKEVFRSATLKRKAWYFNFLEITEHLNHVWLLVNYWMSSSF